MCMWMGLVLHAAAVLSWLLIYRTENYNTLRERVDKLTHKCTCTLCATALLTRALFTATHVAMVHIPRHTTTPNPPPKSVAKQKDKPPSADKRKGRDKRIVQFEQQLQDANRELSQVKMKSMFVIGFTLITLFGVINSSFSGIVIARVH